MSRDRHYVHLQPSEVAVVQAAAHILAAYIAADKVTPENEDEWIDKSIKVALKLAHRVEIGTASGEETRPA